MEYQRSKSLRLDRSSLSTSDLDHHGVLSQTKSVNFHPGAINLRVAGNDSDLGHLSRHQRHFLNRHRQESFTKQKLTCFYIKQ